MSTLVGAVAAKLAETNTSKQRLADRMGVTLVTLNRKLSGESELMLSEACELARFLDSDLELVAGLVGK